MYDTTQDWKYLAKNFNSTSANLIINEVLLRLGIHILAMGYLKKKALYFTKVTKNNKEINKKVKTVFNSKKRSK